MDELVSTFTFRAPTPGRSASAAGGARASAGVGVHLALLALNAEHARLQVASTSRAPDGPLCDCLVLLLPDAQVRVCSTVHMSCPQLHWHSLLVALRQCPCASRVCRRPTRS